MPRFCVCSKQASFGPEGGKAVACKAHALEGMVDVKHKRCAHTDCTSLNPVFNVGGETRGIRCKAHIFEGMVDVVSKRCEHKGCDSTSRTFNVEGETRGRFCKAHAIEGMFDVKNKRCAHEGCTLGPSFNVEGETRGRFCKAHAAKGMVDVVSKRCAHKGCASIGPSFNLEGETRGRFCKAHATKGMVDVVSKRCNHEGCASLQPAFNVKGKKRGMFCKAHATKDMVDVVSPQCKHCNMFHVKKRGDLCFGCRLGTEKAKRKEIEVKEALDAHAILKDYTIHDTRHGCGERAIRPDFAWEGEDLVVILEVDGFAHRNYEPRCEIARLHELQAAFSKPLAVIRYNPDAAWTKLGKRKRGEDDVKDKHAFAAQLVLAALQDRASAIFGDASVAVHGSDALRIVYAGYPAAIATDLLVTIETMHAESAMLAH